MYRIDYSKQADKTLGKWKKSNPALFKKATTVPTNNDIRDPLNPWFDTKKKLTL